MVRLVARAATVRHLVLLLAMAVVVARAVTLPEVLEDQTALQGRMAPLAVATYRIQQVEVRSEVRVVQLLMAEIRLAELVVAAAPQSHRLVLQLLEPLRLSLVRPAH
jgi:hypothetical protein